MPIMKTARIRILEIGGLPCAILGIPVLRIQDFWGDMWSHKIRKSPAIPADAREAVIDSIRSDEYETRLLDPDGPEIEAGPNPGRTWIRGDAAGKLYVWKTANPDVGESDSVENSPQE